MRTNTLDPMHSDGFWNLYSGEREVIGYALTYHDPYDQFAWCQEWRFAIADYLHFVCGENVPGFRPGAFGPEVDGMAYTILCENDFSSESLWYADKILSRFREWLRIAEMDY